MHEPIFQTVFFVTCLKLTEIEKEFRGQILVIHHLRHINCKPVNMMQIAAKSFTVRKCVVLASQRHVEWEIIPLSCVLQDLFAILSLL